MNIRKKTLDKTLDFLQYLSEHKRVTGIHEIVAKRTLPRNMVRALEEIHLLIKVERGIYTPNFKEHEVQPILARRVVEHTNKINYSYLNPKCKDIVEEVPEIQKFSDQELVDELKRRGYKGNVERVTTLKMEI